MSWYETEEKAEKACVATIHTEATIEEFKQLMEDCGVDLVWGPVKKF